MTKVIGVPIGNFMLVLVNEVVTISERRSTDTIQSLQQLFMQPVFLVSVPRYGAPRLRGMNAAILNQLSRLNVSRVAWREYSFF